MADEENRQALARKKRVRAAHRGSVTRILSQVEEVLVSTDTRRLKQLRQTLSEKADVLLKLDGELIEMVEEELEAEVEHADVTREKIDLAIISIDEALAVSAIPDHVTRPRDSEAQESSVRRAEVSPSRLLEFNETAERSAIPPISAGDRQVPTPTTISSAAHSPPTPATPSALSTLGYTSAAPLSAPLSSTLGPLPLTSPQLDGPPFVSAVTPPTTLPRTSVSVLGTPLTPPLGPSHMPAAVTYPPVVHTSPPQVKLPKLSIRKFNGDLTRWVTFWDSFSSAIHANPTLSSVDKFNYLNSLLESSAAEAIAGLTLTSANYDEAIATLKKRFGNPQLIVNRHMEQLLSVTAVVSHNDAKGLRRLHDTVEAHIRGLRALGVSTETYGGLLTSVFVNKLPPEIKLIISREMTGERWDLGAVMRILERKLEARERASTPNAPNTPRRTQPRLPTAATLTTTHAEPSRDVTCVYCGQNHPSGSCTAVTETAARKEMLRRAGRCYVCLRKHHLSRDCRSTHNCKKCRGRHHVSICHRGSPEQRSNTSVPQAPAPTSSAAPSGSADVERPTNALHVGTQTPILLQTAQLQLSNLDSGGLGAVARAIMDSGSQRTYITSRLRDKLQLPTLRTESLRIKTFGSAESNDASCDVVEMGLATRADGTIKISALVVPFICAPLTLQPINHSKESYSHLLGLDLADFADASERLEVDVLIGSDAYWNLVTGRVIRGAGGPTAIQTKVGWVLSGPSNSDQRDVTVNLTLASTHTLKVDVEPTLDDRLKLFWDLESLGIMKDEASVYDKFVQQIRFDGQRYEVSLPWKEHHPPLLDHFELCRKRLTNLLRRLKQTPQLLSDYDSIIRDQLSNGMVEIVDLTAPALSDRVHYLPHHGIIRQDKVTSRLRIVYDASARSTGPSLNDCLYVGPKFGQSIFDILLRFRVQRVVLAGDIEKAFLMVSIQERDRDSLRFLWISDPNADPVELVAFRFTRVVFGVSSSPFLLNATINHHGETFRESDPAFVDKFLSSIYVDDVVTGSKNVKSTFELYTKSKLRLALAGFRLRKFVTNSEELRRIIQEDEPSSRDRETGEKSESPPRDGETGARLESSPEDRRERELAHTEEDQSFAKCSLGVKANETRGVHKILGVQWNFEEDQFLFDIGGVTLMTEDFEPTKRAVVSVTARFFDPLGVLSPVTILFKMFCQQLCEAKIGWDEPLSGGLQEKWDQLLSMLSSANPIVIPRCVFCTDQPTESAKLIGFCDSSSKAYAAVVYLRLESEARVDVKFIAAKTRVAPVGDTTIPRLELLSALLLSRLIASVHTALEPESPLSDPVCFTDSKAALYWIQGVNQEWKQFVENRVTTIRRYVQPRNWRHCPGRENPADIPSRGMDASTLAESSIWLHGPNWLCSNSDSSEEPSIELGDGLVPDNCRIEMRRVPKSTAHSLIGLEENSTEVPSLTQLISPERCSSSHRLFRITAFVLRFIHCLQGQVENSTPLRPTDTLLRTDDVTQARLRWIKDSQSQLEGNERFPFWRQQLDLFKDESGVWRCGGRMSNSSLSQAAQTPILLDKTHYLATLLVIDAHRRVLHNGVRETLAELRSAYWLVRGRQFVRKIIHGCLVCRKFEGRPCQGNPSPPLPAYRVQQSRPFQTTGVDYAGPLYVRSSDPAGHGKVWLCLYTCCVTRAVHLDLVPDMTATAFIRSFKRFTSRRGTPSRMISDNGKTFKSASNLIRESLSSPEARKYFAQTHVEWRFNLEKAPWWGGIFERMIKSAKRCLKKVIGRNCLTYDELLTLATEVEAVLNSRPLTYVSSEDVEEPLTPSHLLVGYRIMTLPDPSLPEDPDYSVENPTRRMVHLTKTLHKFWKRWKREYLLELREFHRTRTDRGSAHTITRGEVVTIYDEGHPRGLWRLGKIEDLMQGADGVIRGVYVQVSSKRGRTKVLRRPVQHIYPLEVYSSSSESGPSARDPMESNSLDTTSSFSPLSNPIEQVNDCTPERRPVRLSAVQTRDQILGCVTD